MNSKTTNITVLLSLIVVGVFVSLGFFGFYGFNFGGSQNGGAVLGETSETNTDTLMELQAQIVTEGTGDAIAPGDTIQVHYTGTLSDGTVFDSSRERGVPLTLLVTENGLRTPDGGTLIAGWDQGLVGMKVGERRLLAIPPALGYGDQAVGPIPPNSVLVFDLEIVSKAPTAP